MACIFCKIIKGEIPSYKLFDSELVYAFLDVQPLSQGHALVVPKHHGEKLTDIPDGSLREILPVVKRLVKATGAVDYNILQNNGRIAHQQVDHVHFHMIPKPNASEGLGIGWPAQTDFSKSQLQALCQQITKAMNSSSDTVKRSVMGRSNKF